MMHSRSASESFSGYKYQTILFLYILTSQFKIEKNYFTDNELNRIGIINDVDWIYCGFELKQDFVEDIHIKLINNDIEFNLDIQCKYGVKTNHLNSSNSKKKKV